MANQIKKKKSRNKILKSSGMCDGPNATFVLLLRYLFSFAFQAKVKAIFKMIAISNYGYD